MPEFLKNSLPKAGFRIWQNISESCILFQKTFQKCTLLMKKMYLIFEEDLQTILSENLIQCSLSLRFLIFRKFYWRIFQRLEVFRKKSVRNCVKYSRWNYSKTSLKKYLLCETNLRQPSKVCILFRLPILTEISSEIISAGYNTSNSRKDFPNTIMVSVCLCKNLAFYHTQFKHMLQ